MSFCHVRLELDDGVVVEDTFAGAPLAADADALHPCITRVLAKLAAGERATVRLAPDDAFGVPEAGRCMPIARDQFADGMALSPGSVVEFDLAGEALAGTVVHAGEDDVVVDFNHPLAGRHVTLTVLKLDAEDTTRPRNGAGGD